MVQTVSGNLGSIHNTLVDVWGQLLEDPVMYSNFMQGEWAQLVQNTYDVLAIINNSNAPVALWAIPRQTALHDSLKVHPVHHAIHAIAAPTLTPSQRVVRAVSPNVKLGETILSQANHAARFFAELDALLKSPFLKDIIGYWSLNKTRSHTLYDVVVALRSDYIQTLSSESNAIETLQNLAILQDFHSGNVVSGKLPLKRFVSSTSISIRIVLNSTTTTNDKFRNSAKDFEAVLRVVNANISAVEQRICDLDEKLDEAEEAKKQRAVRAVAAIIALTFSSSTLLTSFGLIGPVAAALDLAIQTGAGAASVGASVTAVLDSLSTSDLVTVIQSLKATRHTLQHSVDRLKKIRPLFSAVVSSVSALNGTVHGMQDVLVGIQSDVDLGRNDVTFTHEDSKVTQVAWTTIRDDTQVWLDVVNKQGIDPQ
ncbi:hypothetical protein BDN72DRAFT_300252 [Pluteus cervinus]|uniref:Uncharacterized protein n=1 Tax=Pluteus cervinus TaxID=181527 RepID=A0ACD3ADL4_9AGAR|nr:hypothetical protein BDN72DRAFT_300252 [Pluteus cervinus]